MFKYFKNIKIKRQSVIDAAMGQYESEINEEIEKMVSSPCAINGFNNCDRTCVHFKQGTVKFLRWHWSMDDPMFWVDMPKCKLWR